MKPKKKIRKTIFNKIKELYKMREKMKFIHGRTRVEYAGRVYDEEELVNLVDASLDFWLTAGRYAKEFEERLAKSDLL